MDLNMQLVCSLTKEADEEITVPSEVRANYTEIIDDVLARSNLSEITEKKIRNVIQERVEYDITPQKAAIKFLIMERFDIFEAKSRQDQLPVSSVEAAEPAANGHISSQSPSQSSSNVKPEDDESDTSEVDDEAPPKKKVKRPTSAVDDDAAFAARLQAEEDRNSRPTRGAPRKQKAISSKKSKKKTSTKVTGSDDSDVENSPSPKKVNRNTGFHKPYYLSPIAAEFFGAEHISRPQMTKQIWAYIKGNGLQDPADKRFIICDQKMKALVQQDRIQMFKMTKALNSHLGAPVE